MLSKLAASHSSARDGQRKFVLIGNPENRRVRLFQAALNRYGLPPASVLPYQDLLARHVSLAEAVVDPHRHLQRFNRIALVRDAKELTARNPVADEVVGKAQVVASVPARHTTSGSGANRFVFDTRLQGPLLGLAFHF